ncbi:IS3 family transposase [Virgibacillus halophilus]|uniref:IS3 family transposase n=1 Tax=Tigheibacillus halophilus TaxID=361280 RepID=A0ABU5C619_9BACI|nr:IS3 family transposase [Virgibacillus halophilus]
MQTKKRKKKLAAQVKRIFVESEKRYGSPKITRILNENGWNVSQKTVTRIMSENSLRSKTVKKYKATTNSKHNYPVIC